MPPHELDIVKDKLSYIMKLVEEQHDKYIEQTSWIGVMIRLSLKRPRPIFVQKLMVYVVVIGYIHRK